MFDKAVYLAPVFNPALRAELVPALGAKAAPFFTCMAPHGIPPTTAWDPTRERLFLALADENVPDALFSAPQLAAARRPGPRTHTGLLNSVAAALLDDVCDFLTR